jgi:hypothetical protein
VPETPYVQVIHGTWNPPVDGQQMWYQLHDDEINFCHQLNNCFDELRFGAPVWRPGGPASFKWSGANQHEDRVEGGKALVKQWRALLDADPHARIHIVAHSHGCNVVLYAIQQYLIDLKDEAKQLLDQAERECLDKTVHEALRSAFADKFGHRAEERWSENAATLAIVDQEPEPEPPPPDTTKDPGESESPMVRDLSETLGPPLAALRDKLKPTIDRYSQNFNLSSISFADCSIFDGLK